MSKGHDFDFLFGSWRVRHRRLRLRGCGCTDWNEVFGTAETRPLLGGMCNIEEHSLPLSLPSGIALRTFDPSQELWSIYWVSEQDGCLQPPVCGSFQGDLGRFEGRDADKGRPVEVRFVWDRSNPHSPQWAQSFSYDGGASWELNWMMRFEKADGLK